MTQNKKNSPLLILAPMAGITDLAFRLLCKEHGADIVYSEMISVAGLTYSKTSQSKTFKLVKSVLAESPFFIQLFGSIPIQFAQAAKILDELPKMEDCQKLRKKENSKPQDDNRPTVLRQPEGIDINFGCPVKKILRQGAGCSLMKKPQLARQIIQAVCDNTSLPISIKIRAGIEDINALSFLEAVADLPLQTIIVHGRTFKQGFSGPIDFSLIKKIKKIHPKKTIIANGGIFSPKIAQEALEKTGADGLAIGRGALGRPWIFQQIKAAVQNHPIREKTPSLIRKTALHHAILVDRYFGSRGFFEFRKHLGWYFKGLPDAKQLRSRLYSVEKLSDVENILIDNLTRKSPDDTIKKIGVSIKNNQKIK